MVFLVLLNSWETPVLLPKAMRSAESQVTNWAQKVDVMIMAHKTSFWGENSVWLPKQGLTIFLSPQIVLPKDVWCCFCPGDEICVFCVNSLYPDPFFPANWQGLEQPTGLLQPVENTAQGGRGTSEQTGYPTWTGVPTSAGPLDTA